MLHFDFKRKVYKKSHIQYSPAISNFFPGPFSIYALLHYKVSRYLELRYLELFAISN